MTLTICYIPYAFYDYYVDSSIGTVTGTSNLYVSRLFNFTPSVSRTTYAIIDLSNIPSNEEINSISLKFEAPEYYASKGINKDYNVAVWNGTYYQNLLNGSNKLWNAGTQIIPFDSSEFSLISTTSLIVRISTQAVADKFKNMTVYAYEHNLSNSIRLEVYSSPKKKKDLLRLTNRKKLKCLRV